MNYSLDYLCYLVHCKNLDNKIRVNRYYKLRKSEEKLQAAVHLARIYPDTLEVAIVEFKDAAQEVERAAAQRKSHTLHIKEVWKALGVRIRHDGTGGVKFIAYVDDPGETCFVLPKEIEERHNNYVAEKYLLGS